MSTLPSSGVNPRFEAAMTLGRCWAWFVALGAILVILGVAAIGSQFVATITSVLLFGSLLLAGGVVQLVNAVLARTWGGFFLSLLAGIVHLVVGTFMVENPIRAAVDITLILAVAFMVGGAIRVAYVLFQRFQGWAWVLLNGLITFFLGVAIWRQWPEASVWVIGLFVGIDLVFNGWSWVMLGLAVKAAAPKVETREPAFAK
jgi:uncharacterized membrane protein HdeD (DUF308 family)